MIYRLRVKKKDFTIRTPAIDAATPTDAIAKVTSVYPDASEVKVLTQLSRVTDDWGHDYEH